MPYYMPEGYLWMPLSKNIILETLLPPPRPQRNSETRTATTQWRPRGEWPPTQWGTPLFRPSIWGQNPRCLPTCLSFSSLPTGNSSAPAPLTRPWKPQVSLFPQALLSPMTSEELWRILFGYTARARRGTLQRRLWLQRGPSELTKRADQESRPQERGPREISAAPWDIDSDGYEAGQQQFPKTQTAAARIGTRDKNIAGTNWRKRGVGTNARIHQSKMKHGNIRTQWSNHRKTWSS